MALDTGLTVQDVRDGALRTAKADTLPTAETQTAGTRVPHG